MLKCNGGNSCFVENGKVTPKKIDQKTIDILNNHCRDPRNCPPPSADQIKKSVAAIRAYEKSESLLVAPITTNPALGYFVFCTKSVEGQCWAVDDETSEVLGKIEDKKWFYLYFCETGSLSSLFNSVSKSFTNSLRYFVLVVNE